MMYLNANHIFATLDCVRIETVSVLWRGEIGTIVHRGVAIWRMVSFSPLVEKYPLANTPIVL